MWKLWLKRAGILVLAAVLLFVFGWVPWFLAGVATTRRYVFPDHENAGLTPASFKLASDEVTPVSYTHLTLPTILLV